jgi:hypothetical protein
MSIVTGNITHDGATIVVFVGVSKRREEQLAKAGFKIPPTIAVCAQIDTGSFATVFMPKTFRALGVTPFSTIKIRTPSTKPGEPCETDQYDVSVTLVSGITQVVIPSVRAIASDDFDADDGSVQALIGRDILAGCVFEYFGLHTSFRLSF